jgi:hypothetical protein
VSAPVINLDDYRHIHAAEPRPPDLLTEAISFLRRRKPLTEQEREFLGEIIRFCRAYPDRLSDWEREFLEAIEWSQTLSDRQRLALDRIVEKIERFLARTRTSP